MTETKKPEGSQQPWLTRKIKLPTTEAAVRKLADGVHEAFGFKDYDTTLLTVCTTLKHLPKDQGSVSMSYLGDCVRWRLSYEAAQSVGAQASGKIQVRELSKFIDKDPGNLQAMDEMRKLAQMGVPEAIAYVAETEKANVPN